MKLGETNVGLIRRAMACRVKYRVKSAAGLTKRRMGLSLLGVHPRNRGGVYCTDTTVQNLGFGLLEKGFSVGEANREGVCAQEVPASERSKDPLDHKKPYKT